MAADPDYPLEEVPQSARRGMLSLLVVLTGFVFFTPTMLAGADLATAFALTDFLGVLTAGSLILGVYVAVLALIGARAGLTTVLLARFTLGSWGAKWASLLLGGTQVGWYAVTVAFMAQLIAQAFGWQSLTWLLIIVGAALTGVTAYFGYRGMEALSAISVPLLLGLAIWVMYAALDKAGGWSGLAALEPAGSMGWAAAITMVVGTFASGGTQAPNWSRFARLPRQAFIAAFGAFFVANLLMVLFGGVGAMAYGEGDFVAVLLQLGLTTAAMIMLVFNVWTTQDNAAYAFGVAGAEITGVPRKRPFIIGGVVIAVILALTGIYDFLPDYLTALGILIPPLGGAIIGDYFFVRRGSLPSPASADLPRIRWGGVLSYLLGTAAAALGSIYEIGIPPVQGILVAAILMPLLSRRPAADTKEADHG